MRSFGETTNKATKLKLMCNVDTIIQLWRFVVSNVYLFIFLFIIHYQDSTGLDHQVSCFLTWEALAHPSHPFFLSFIEKLSNMNVWVYTKNPKFYLFCLLHVDFVREVTVVDMGTRDL